MTYDLWYWPSIPGRGEFVRLAMEAGGIAYRDRAREVGEKGLMADMKAREPAPFAPPYLVAQDGSVTWQVANVLLYLARVEQLSDEADRDWLHGLQLTISDLVAEVHNVHHPVGVADYYDDQKPEAARAAQQFREERIPKFLGYFENALAPRGGDWMAGNRWTPVDTSLFQVIAGLRYAFPKRMRTVERDIPALVALHDRVAALPGLVDYLASKRRMAFNQDGIFRHYPELDAA